MVLGAEDEFIDIDKGRIFAHILVIIFVMSQWEKLGIEDVPILIFGLPGNVHYMFFIVLPNFIELLDLFFFAESKTTQVDSFFGRCLISWARPQIPYRPYIVIDEKFVHSIFNMVCHPLSNVGDILLHP